MCACVCLCASVRCVRTAWTLDKVREECYALAEEHSQAMQVPPLFFPKISDLVIWVSKNSALPRARAPRSLSMLDVLLLSGSW
jgi:hypothetical protein